MFKKRSVYRSERRSSSGVSAAALLVFLGAVAAGVWFLMRDLSGPSVTMDPPHSGRMGIAQSVRLSMDDKSGVQSVAVTVRRGAQSMIVLKEKYAELEKHREAVFSLKDTQLPEGSFELEIKAQDGSFAGFGFGNSTTLRLPVILDAQPPRIAVKTMPPSIRRGGAALIVYTVSEDVDRTGVRLGQSFFHAFRQPNGSYACLFPFPITYKTSEFFPEVLARDLAGNVTSSRLPVRAVNRTFRSDTLKIPESFLNFKAAELAQICPEKSTSLEQYLCANSKERAIDDAKLIEIGSDPARTSPSFLWTGRFLQLPKSAVKARYGDFRSYVDDNRQKIDEQTHMGLDLASVARAEVPAAQHGRVIWTGYLGIHGNMVLVDHGMGLATQYSHLSEYSVQVGDEVQPGQIIGRTGTTGLAGGDHLHFGVLIGGIPVEPLEWLDPKWLKNNITDRLNTPL
ncbi:MAG: M23 family metallopeptidase [Mailhella sp.]|nr:M23 family metallopeptidase [Mailhella sp.]